MCLESGGLYRLYRATDDMLPETGDAKTAGAKIVAVQEQKLLLISGDGRGRESRAMTGLKSI